MARIVVPIVCFGAALVTAAVFGIVMHDGLGITRATIRTDALAFAALVGSAMATRALMKRDE